MLVTHQNPRLERTVYNEVEGALYTYYDSLIESGKNSIRFSGLIVFDKNVGIHF